VTVSLRNLVGGYVVLLQLGLFLVTSWFEK